MTRAGFATVWPRFVPFYNPFMRVLPYFAVAATLSVAVTGVFDLAWAQTSPAPTIREGGATRAPAIAASPNTSPSSSNQLIERIRVENAEVRIDEVRVGGETRSISVLPKGGFPVYDVKPSTGERTWKVLGF